MEVPCQNEFENLDFCHVIWYIQNYQMPFPSTFLKIILSLTNIVYVHSNSIKHGVVMWNSTMRGLKINPHLCEI